MRLASVWLWCSVLASPAMAELLPPTMAPASGGRAPHAALAEVMVPSGLRVPFIVAPDGVLDGSDGLPPRVPHTPGSAALALWAVGGIGVWQISRCTRKLDRSWLPGWYHTGGPRQVGQATPLELDWAGVPQPAIRLLPRLPLQAPLYSIACLHRPRGRPVLPLAPRAPPREDRRVTIFASEHQSLF